MTELQKNNSVRSSNAAVQKFSTNRKEKMKKYVKKETSNSSDDGYGENELLEISSYLDPSDDSDTLCNAISRRSESKILMVKISENIDLEW